MAKDRARSIRVAAIQAAPAYLDLNATLERVDLWARRAADDGAKIVVFPETFVPGYPAWVDVSPKVALWNDAGVKAVYARLLDNSVEVPGPATEALAATAAQASITMIVGVHERAGRSLYNALLTFDSEKGLLNHHRKLIPTHGERLIWGQGDAHGLRVVQSASVRVGGLICWEHWMPLSRQVLHDGGEEIHAAVWPEAKEMYQVASRHYAFEGRCFVVVAGSIMRREDMPEELDLSAEAAGAPVDGMPIRGGSAIIGPDGRYLAEPVYGEETVVIADCDLAEIARESMALDVSGHYSRPDIFELRVRASR